MTATMFLTGGEAVRPPEPPLAERPRLSLLDGLRLIQTPSSEAGVQAFHRSLEGVPVDPQTLLAELAALREGRATRFELLAQIATSPAAKARGVSGPGLLLLRLARKAFVASGAAGRIRARRALVAGAQDAALAASGIPTTPSDISRKLVLLDGALLRLENHVFAQSRALEAAAFAVLEARVAALEAELRTRVSSGPTPPTRSE